MMLIKNVHIVRERKKHHHYDIGNLQKEREMMMLILLMTIQLVLDTFSKINKKPQTMMMTMTVTMMIFTMIEL